MKRIGLILILSALAANAADSTAVGNTRDDHRARMAKAIEARDFDAWKAERDAWGGRGQARQNVTRENFESFARLHEAVKAGRTDEATALRQQLGLGPRAGMAAGNGKGQGGKQGRGNGQGAGRGNGNGQGCRKSL